MIWLLTGGPEAVVVLEVPVVWVVVEALGVAVSLSMVVVVMVEAVVVVAEVREGRVVLQSVWLWLVMHLGQVVL